MTINGQPIEPLDGVLLAIALSGFAYGFYCQTRARNYISREKVSELKDLSKLATGPMPPKEILSEEGLRYYRGFTIGLVVFLVCIFLLLLIHH
jgi:hypothetical protein